MDVGGGNKRVHRERPKKRNEIKGDLEENNEEKKLRRNRDRFPQYYSTSLFGASQF